MGENIIGNYDNVAKFLNPDNTEGSVISQGTKSAQTRAYGVE